MPKIASAYQSIKDRFYRAPQTYKSLEDLYRRTDPVVNMDFDELVTTKTLELMGKTIYQAEQKVKRLKAALKLLVKDNGRNVTKKPRNEVFSRWNKACCTVSRGVPIAGTCRGETFMSWARRRAAKTSAKEKAKTNTAKEPSHDDVEDHEKIQQNGDGEIEGTNKKPRSKLMRERRLR
ncbi:hypothetical protein DOTSEDRAFT_29661 [Dothistroma septosporum NZE10]|uniref:Uncharacterized protein n=1 Tax=Dothistroma septosporum (strain NZE10 / CBS 128990) TaxID=675120 RepID=M2XZE3_DOTSN|nr:hypothetical protein DOTSEDRAFT_29661 [Dothistroma septosporum NZE10]